MDRDRFDEIVSRYADGGATAQEIAEIEASLKEDAALRRDFVDRMRLETGLATLAESVPAQRATRRTPVRVASRPGAAMWAAAAILAAATLVLLLRPRPTPPPAEFAAPTPSRRNVEEDRKNLEVELAALRQKEAEAARERERHVQEAEDDLRRTAEERLRRIQAERAAAEERLTRLPAPEPPPAPTPPAPKGPAPTEVAPARIDRTEGEVFVLTSAGRRPAAAAQSILGGEGIECPGSRGFAILSYADHTRLEVAAQSRIRLAPESDGKRIVVERGAVKAEVAKQPKDRPMVFATPHGEARVLGTTLRVTVDAATAVEVEEGKVDLRNAAGKSVEVAAGRTASTTTLVARPLSREEVLLWLDFEDGKTPAIVETGAVEKGPGNRLCLAGVPDPAGVSRYFIGDAGPGFFLFQGDEVLTFDYWAEDQTLQINFNMLDRTQGKTFAGALDKPAAGKWTHASFRIADLESPGARIAEEDWIVSLYLQSVGITPRKIYIDNVQILRPRTLRPRPSDAKK